ncbi:MAG: TetR/AcrR family transcriptional regulator [Chloroflexi bacterium]|nr:TetR/AcrR family transcriptional regulator [Chloroflexota bacterium]
MVADRRVAAQTEALTRELPGLPSEPVPIPLAVDGATLSPKGLRTRTRLLEAAEHVFGELGWEEASIVRITERAGVAQGTFYRYFVSKQAIFDELMVDLNRRVRQAMAVGAARGRTRVETERGGFEGFFRFTSEHPALYRVIRQAEFASPTALRRHYERIAQGYATALAASMDAGEIAPGDPEVLAYALMGIGELIGMRWITWDDAGSVPTEVIDELMRFIARGLGAE